MRRAACRTEANKHVFSYLAVHPTPARADGAAHKSTEQPYSHLYTLVWLGCIFSFGTGPLSPGSYPTRSGQQRTTSDESQSTKPAATFFQTPRPVVNLSNATCLTRFELPFQGVSGVAGDQKNHPNQAFILSTQVAQRIQKPDCRVVLPVARKPTNTHYVLASHPTYYWTKT